MKKNVFIIIIFLITLVLLVLVFVSGVWKPKNAGIMIRSNVNSIVYINEEKAGNSPLEKVQSPGLVRVRVVTDNASVSNSYESDIVLVSGVQTILEIDFGQDTNSNRIELVSFEKGPKDEASLSVVSEPQNTRVEINGEIKGFTPYSTRISEGNHTIKLQLDENNTKLVDVKTKIGYKLTLYVKLPSVDMVEDSLMREEPIPVQVRIKDTPTGFLRVRDGPSTSGLEVARVLPGEEYLVEEVSADGEWLMIKYAEDEAGWINRIYAL